MATCLCIRCRTPACLRLQTQDAEAKRERTVAALTEGWATELRRQKEAWAGAERIKREAWAEAKTAEIKELTIKVGGGGEGS